MSDNNRVKLITNKEYVFVAADALVNGLKMAIGIWSGLLLTVFLKLSQENYKKLAAYLVAVQVVSIFTGYFLARLVDRVKNIKRFAALTYVPSSLLPVALTLPLAYFFPHMADGAKMLYVVVVNLLITVVGTLSGNAWSLMDIRITPDDKERSYFYTIKNLISSSLGSLGAPATWVTIFLFKALLPYDLGEDAVNAHIYFYGLLLFTVIAMPVTLAYLKVRKIRIKTPPREKPENIVTIAKAMARNKPLWLKRLSSILLAWGGLSGSAYALLVSKYYYGVTINLFGFSFVPDVATLMLVFSCTQTIPAMISIPLALAIRKRVPDKTLILATMIYVAVGGVLFYVLLADVFFVTTAIQRFYLHLLSYGWGGIIFGFQICNNIIDLELIDYMEWQSGQRNECTYNFIIDNIQKVLTLPIGYVAAILLISTGFKTDSGDRITEEGMRKGLIALSVLVPSIFSLLAAIPLFFYDFTGERRRAIMQELKNRREDIMPKAQAASKAMAEDFNIYC